MSAVAGSPNPQGFRPSLFSDRWRLSNRAFEFYESHRAYTGSHFSAPALPFIPLARNISDMQCPGASGKTGKFQEGDKTGKALPI